MQNKVNLFHSKGQSKSLRGPCHRLGANLSAPPVLPARVRGTQTPHTGPACGQAGAACAPLSHETQRKRAPHRVSLQFQQISHRGKASASHTPAVQPGQALPPTLLAKSLNAQPEATSILFCPFFPNHPSSWDSEGEKTLLGTSTPCCSPGRRRGGRRR